MRLKEKTYQVDTNGPLTDLRGQRINLRDQFPDEKSYQDFIHEELTEGKSWSVLGGQLPEVNYRFGTDPNDYQNVNDFKEASGLLDEETLKWWTPDVTRRLLRVYRDSGKPRVFKKYFLGHAYHNRLTGNIGAKSINDLVAELAHAFQYENKILRGQKNFKKNGFFQFFVRPFSRFKQAKKLESISPYSDSENNEYRAHQIIEPILQRYIFKNDESAYNNLMQSKGLPEDQQFERLKNYTRSLNEDEN